MRISILLPYKENFSKQKAGAVSIFVNDIIRNSKYKKDIKIFGNTNHKDLLNNKYINLDYDKSIFKSNTKSYIKRFIENEYNNNSDLIEIHNRPNYIAPIKKVTGAKIIFYFHNDPLTMNGSKSTKERSNILKDTDQIIFNSKWSRNRFLTNLKNVDKFIAKISIIYQSVEKKKINFNKKKKIISFIGKLNKAKGYDVFGKAIIRILDKYKDWRAIVIGDEPRETHTFAHKNLKLYGFKDHTFILKKLEEVSISVICSRWEEPLGRASLEACSRGCAPIITNRGGLPETTTYPVLINKLTESNLFSKINYLIKNKSIRKNIQKTNYKKFKFTNKFINNQIDALRKKLFINKNVNIIRSANKFKILHITNFNDRHDGRLQYNTGRRINNGFIRDNHNVVTISDRDIIHVSKTPFDITGSKTLNRKIISTAKTFKPDLVVLGHADSVTNNTISELKNMNKSIKFSQWFLDPVSKSGPDYIKNKSRILDKSKHMDASFITTDPKSLDFEIINSFYIPNPCDKSFETLNNFNFDGNNDLFFAMSHGVHRGTLKRGKTDDREKFLNKLTKISDKQIIFDFYGLNNKQPIWAGDFLDIISNCNMGLNLSRGKPTKYYSSDRIAQLFGNGLLTFIDSNTKYDDFFNNNEAIFYNNISDLSEKILKYKKDSKNRKLIAKNGKNKYFKYFNSSLVSDYIVKKTLDIKSSNKFLWD